MTKETSPRNIPPSQPENASYHRVLRDAARNICKTAIENAQAQILKETARNSMCKLPVEDNVCVHRKVVSQSPGIDKSGVQSIASTSEEAIPPSTHNIMATNHNKAGASQMKVSRKRIPRAQSIFSFQPVLLARRGMSTIFSYTF